MIPLRDRHLPHRPPVVTSCLLGVAIALFVWELHLSFTKELAPFLQTWGIVPDRFWHTATIALEEKNPAAAVVLVAMTGRSLLGALFLHSSFSQLLGNGLFLWVFGKSVEDRLGHGGFLLTYLCCGGATGLVQILLAPDLNAPLVGANGAIAAILGMYLVFFPKARIESILPLLVLFIPIDLPALFYLLWWFVQQMFYGIGVLNVPGGVNPFGIGYWAHGIGIPLGMAIALWLQRQQKRDR